MESFGARLKREREQRKITLDDIAVSTKIGTRFLAAIEEDRFDQLPGGIFNKGFVRAYARHLGMDENQAIADFVAATEPVLPEPPPPDAPVLAALAERVPEAKKKSRADGGIPWGIFAIVLLVLACGFALWGFHSREKPARPGIEVPGPAKPDASALEDQKGAPANAAKSAASAPMAATSPEAPPRSAPSTPESAVSPAAATPSQADAGLFHVLDQGPSGLLGRHHRRRKTDRAGHARRSRRTVYRSPGPDRDQDRQHRRPGNLIQWKEAGATRRLQPGKDTNL